MCTQVQCAGLQGLADGRRWEEIVVGPDDGLTLHFKVTSSTWQKLLIPGRQLEHVAGIMREAPVHYCGMC